MTIGIALLIFFVLLMLGTPIAICLAGTGMFWLMSSPNLPNITFVTKVISSTDSFSLMAIPFFMMAGQLMEQTGITDRFIKFSKSVVGHITGGISHTAMVTGVIMAGVSGSGNADAAAIGAVMIPSMVKEGYDEGFSCSVIAAAGCLGPIIPPSIMMIVFANAADYSVGKLFMGGIIPGLLMAIGNMVVCYLYAKRCKMRRSKFVGLKEVLVTFIKSAPALAMPAIIIIGVVSGICTATEAGVLACVYGLIYGLVAKKLNFKTIKDCLLNASLASAGPVMIITYSGIFSYMLTRMNVAKQLGVFCNTYISSEAGFFFFLLGVGLVLGCFIDGLASTVMLLPVMAPVAVAMGISFQHFAIVYLLCLLTSQLTPPVGNLLFVSAGILKTPIGAVYKTVWPFVVVMISVIILCIYIPALTTWLPAIVK